MKTLSLSIVLLLCACEPAPTCGDRYEVEGATKTVPAGECWRLRVLTDDLRLRLGGETCSEVRECLTATEGQTVSVLSSYGASDDAPLQVAFAPWDCDALETACEGP